jgi:hypothetical protein
MKHFAGADLHKRVSQLAVLREKKPPPSTDSPISSMEYSMGSRL